MDDARRKILAGAQLRRLRTTLGLSQSAMAAELGISVSYFNLVERNQRPLTAQLLIRLSETYAIDVHAFSGTEEAGALAEVEAILADPVLRGVTVPRAELRAAIDAAPGVVTALRRLHAAWAELAEARAGLAEGGAERDGAGREPGADCGRRGRAGPRVPPARIQPLPRPRGAGRAAGGRARRGRRRRRRDPRAAPRPARHAGRGPAPCRDGRDAPPPRPPPPPPDDLRAAGACRPHLPDGDPARADGGRRRARRGAGGQRARRRPRRAGSGGSRSPTTSRRRS